MIKKEVEELEKSIDEAIANRKPLPIAKGNDETSREVKRIVIRKIMSIKPKGISFLD